jgi:hypothetical protein
MKSPRKKKAFVPKALAPSEADEQIALVEYLRTAYPNIFFTIAPAGFKLPYPINVIFSKQANQMGYRKGTPDIMIFAARHIFHGLLIELKIKGGKQKTEQKEVQEMVTRVGYKYALCFGFNEAREVIDKYFEKRLGW